MTKKSTPWFSLNHDLDKVDNIVFLTTEAFSLYMAQNDPEEIKPLVFDTEEDMCRNKNLPSK